LGNLEADAVDLAALGWTPALAALFKPFASEGLLPGRVAVQHKHIYRLYAEAGEFVARVSGRLRHEAEKPRDFPVAGDWVALHPRPDEGRATIHHVLPRQSRFSRRAPGPVTEEQVLAANVDTVFLVMGLDHDYNLRRIERYLATARESGASPVVVLTKSDICDDAEAKRAEVESLGSGVPVHALSPRRGDGLEAIALYLKPGRTVALLGSSGVGKSTLINRLLGADRLRTRDVRRGDDHGRHTTTHRELILLPEGGLVLDTPGMRELQLWDADEGVSGTFEEILSLAAECAFADCRHEDEPRCAVRGAVEAGTLSRARVESYRKLQRELRYLSRRQDRWAQIEEKRRWKSITRLANRHKPRE
jgi:ribosome biogenesis GTPase